MPVITPTGGGGGSSGTPITDLGTVHAATLATGGPQTLFSPAIGTYVLVSMATAGYVAHDAFVLSVRIIADIADDLYWTNISPNAVINQAVFGFKDGWVIRGTPLVAMLFTDTNFLPIAAAPPAWQAGTVYAANFLIIGPDSHIWSASGGTSGGLIPNFAANHGGSVVDNTVTWTDEGAIPTAGSLHLYALTA